MQAGGVGCWEAGLSGVRIVNSHPQELTGSDSQSSKEALGMRLLSLLPGTQPCLGAQARLGKWGWAGARYSPLWLSPSLLR